MLGNRDRIQVTDGTAFMDGAVVRRMLRDSQSLLWNLDKCGYASELTSIEKVLKGLGQHWESQHRLHQADVADYEATATAVQQANPHLVLNVETECQVDHSMVDLGAIIENNITGTFYLLQTGRTHWIQLTQERRELDCVHHISAYEEFGSLGTEGLFSENNTYRSYSANKARSVHLVNVWQHTFGLAVMHTNCSNNYFPWKFAQKLITVVILEQAAGEPIPLDGNGQNARDWLDMEDYEDALLLAATQGQLGHRYCVGCHEERTNKKVEEAIFQQFNEPRLEGAAHESHNPSLIDRPAHDRRYTYNPKDIKSELGGQSRHIFDKGRAATLCRRKRTYQTTS